MALLVFSTAAMAGILHDGLASHMPVLQLDALDEDFRQEDQK